MRPRRRDGQPAAAPKETEFEKYSAQIAIWNALLKAFGRNGELHRMKQTLCAMQNQTQLTPDRKTFVLLLSAFDHCGALDEAETVWQCDILDPEIKFDRFVVTALVDGLARSGRIREAKRRTTYQLTNLPTMAPCRRL